MSKDSYSELIRVIVRDVHHVHASSWPSSVSQFVQPLQNAMKIPRWLKSGLVPYTDERVVNLLNELRVSEDASGVDLWDATDDIVDSNVQNQLHVVFNTALVDCARIRAVVEMEEATQTCCTKESFLAVLMQDAIMHAHKEVSLLEDVPVAFSRSFSSVTLLVPGLIERSFRASLIVAVCEVMPVWKIGFNSGNRCDGGPSKAPVRVRCMSTVEDFTRSSTPSQEFEEEPEPDKPVVSPWLQAYFVVHPPSNMLPSICHVPVLCMAEEEQLPMLMSSLLYQRHVWHIGDPLIGVAFSKYDTTIRLFVGWLKDVPGCALPRVHVGEIRTPTKLDLSSPSVALIVSRLLFSLESHISGVRDAMRHSVGTVIREMELRSSLPWRIDTDVPEDESVPVLENNDTKDRIKRWVQSQKSEAMPLHKGVDYATRGYAKSISSDPSKEESGVTLTPAIMEPEGRSYFACSKFATTSKATDERVFGWMFGRRVAPQSVPYRPDFCEKYIEMTDFIWPEEWNTEEDLPAVDAALKPLVKELVKSVDALKAGYGPIRCVLKDKFPIDLQILERSFSAIFQASFRSREKTENPKFVNETSWRHDHDRLLQDFFVRLVTLIQPDGARTTIEDPLTRPTLEATLRMPKSDALQPDSRDLFEKASENLLTSRPDKIRDWVKKRGGATRKADEDGQHHFYVDAQYSSWREKNDAATELQIIDELIQQPLRGTCDAFGRLLVKLPKRSPDEICPVPLVIHRAAIDKKSSTLKPEANRKGKGEQAAESSRDHLSVEETLGSMKGKRYTALASAFRPSIPSLDQDETVNALISEIQDLRLVADPTHLDLPLLAVEYKKASCSQMMATNQVRMYLTASVKFLEALGIRNFAVYGIQAEGPRLAIPAAIVRDDSFVYVFERLVQEVDISTPLGAFHYVTILCRLAQNHAEDLRKRFETVKGQLGSVEDWTMDKQHEELRGRANELKKLEISSGAEKAEV